MPLDFGKLRKAYNKNAELMRTVEDFWHSYNYQTESFYDFYDEIINNIQENLQKLADMRRGFKLELKYKKEDAIAYGGEEIKLFSNHSKYFRFFIEDIYLKAYCRISEVGVYVSNKAIKFVTVDCSQPIYTVRLTTEQATLIKENIKSELILPLFDKRLRNFDYKITVGCMDRILLSLRDLCIGDITGFERAAVSSTDDGVVTEVKADKNYFIKTDFEEYYRPYIQEAVDDILNDVFKNACYALENEFPENKLFEDWILRQARENKVYSDYMTFIVKLWDYSYNSESDVDGERLGHNNVMTIYLDEKKENLLITIPIRMCINFKTFDYTLKLPEAKIISIPLTTYRSEFLKIYKKEYIDYFKRIKIPNKEHLEHLYDMVHEKLYQLGFTVIQNYVEDNGNCKFELQMPENV